MCGDLAALFSRPRLIFLGTMVIVWGVLALLAAVCVCVCTAAGFVAHQSRQSFGCCGRSLQGMCACVCVCVHVCVYAVWCVEWEEEEEVSVVRDVLAYPLSVAVLWICVPELFCWEWWPQSQTFSPRAVVVCTMSRDGDHPAALSFLPLMCGMSLGDGDDERGGWS